MLNPVLRGGDRPVQKVSAPQLSLKEEEEEAVEAELRQGLK